MTEKTLKKLKNFFSAYELKKSKKGELLFKPEEDKGGVVFIKKGYARAYTLSSEGEERTLAMVKPLFYCSLLGAVTGKKSPFYFEAISPIEMWVAPKEDFLRYIAKESGLYEELTISLLLELSELTINAQTLISGSAENKIGSLILRLSERFGEKEKGGIRIKFSIPHRIIASMTGLTRETVTLQILKMEKEKVLKKEKRSLIVIDKEKLAEMA